MKASEYIAELQSLIDKHGDLPVCYICEDHYYSKQDASPWYVGKDSEQIELDIFDEDVVKEGFFAV